MESLDFLFVKTQKLISFFDTLYTARVILIVVAGLMFVFLWFDKSRPLRDFAVGFAMALFFHFVTPHSSDFLHIDTLESLNYDIPSPRVIVLNFAFFSFMSILIWKFFTKKD